MDVIDLQRASGRAADPGFCGELALAARTVPDCALDRDGESPGVVGFGVHRRYSPHTAFSLGSLPRCIFEFSVALLSLELEKVRKRLFQNHCGGGVAVRKQLFELGQCIVDIPRILRSRSARSRAGYGIQLGRSPRCGLVYGES